MASSLDIVVHQDVVGGIVFCDCPVQPSGLAAAFLALTIVSVAVEGCVQHWRCILPDEDIHDLPGNMAICLR